jgi:hypothetical protein
MAPALAEDAAHAVFNGAWLGGCSWEKVQPELTARGWEVQTVDLPSAADLGGPRFGLHEDAAVEPQACMAGSTTSSIDAVGSSQTTAARVLRRERD